MIEAELLIEHLQRHSRHKSYNKEFTLRLGISGPPGAGKSTFIEAIGCTFVEKGHSVAVLTIGANLLKVSLNSII